MTDQPVTHIHRDIRTLATPDVLFMEGKIGFVIHQHPGGDQEHYQHGKHPNMWGQGWDCLNIQGDLHYHRAEIKNA